MKFDKSSMFDLINKKLAALVFFGAVSLYFVDYFLSTELMPMADVSVYQNPGMAFGFNIASMILWGIRFIFLTAMFIWLNVYYAMDKSSPTSLYMFMMLIGGLANAISSFLHGVIFDYIVIVDKGAGGRIACNISDIVVTIGTLGYIYEALKMIIKIR